MSGDDSAAAVEPGEHARRREAVAVYTQQLDALQDARQA